MPFLVALVLLALLALTQLVGFAHVDGHADFHGDFDTDVGDIGFGDTLASLLGFGRLPLLAWLSVLLAAFALIGLSGQRLLAGFIGHMVPALPASGLAFLAALPATGLLTRALARIWPQDESTAIDIEALLARRGHVVIGTATRGNPARVSVRDQHGQTHHVMVEPHLDGVSMPQGAEVLLVRREGDLFYAVPCDPPFLTAGI